MIKIQLNCYDKCNVKIENVFAFIDDDDINIVNSFKRWSVTLYKKGRFGYAISTLKKDGKYFTISMHRLIMGCSFKDNKEIDHIDGNTLNNQKSNLRICTHRENAYNRKRKHNGSSKYKGVHSIKWMSKGEYIQRWGAKITTNDKKHIHLGCFKTQEEAAYAYNMASIKYHGEFGYLNEIKKY